MKELKQRYNGNLLGKSHYLYRQGFVRGIELSNAVITIKKTFMIKKKQKLLFSIKQINKKKLKVQCMRLVTWVPAAHMIPDLFLQLVLVLSF